MAVYILIDVTNKIVGYVGRTARTPAIRFVQHMEESQKIGFDPSRCIFDSSANWLAYCIEHGYEVEVFEVLAGEDSDDSLERFWIHRCVDMRIKLSNRCYYGWIPYAYDRLPCPYHHDCTEHAIRTAQLPLFCDV